VKETERFRLQILEENCMGCHACEVACKQEHELGVGPRLIRIVEDSPRYEPIYCHHCADAPCRDVCPVEAITIGPGGAVLLDAESCTGCRECLEACPFGALQFDEVEGVAIKCDLCYKRLGEGREPACIAVCPTRAIRRIQL
jgi:anaerobic dimethyl sulfoxide reductase subunit B (iron-sulfur subunit)